MGPRPCPILPTPILWGEEPCGGLLGALQCLTFVLFVRGIAVAIVLESAMPASLGGQPQDNGGALFVKDAGLFHCL